jgi:peptide/nickel transport system substrate-binding protein
MPSPGLSRRSFLGAAAGGAAGATAGCFSRLRSRIAYTAASQVELSVKTVPADRDPSAVLIGRELQDNLEAVGVDVSHELIDEVQLLRDVFLNHDFDVFITELPGHGDPDELRTLLHSRFGPELGLQNPFGYASHRTDELLEAQRRPPDDGGSATSDGTGETTAAEQDGTSGGADEGLADVDRAEIVERLQRQLLVQQPFLTVVSRPHVTAVAPNLAVGGDVSFATSLSYLTVDRPGESFDTLNVGLQRPNVTDNRNVLAVEYRLHDRLTDLLYDPLARRIGDEYVPWLARSFSVDGNAITVELRPNQHWHDGTPLTAEDVAFTYRFCRDTALGGADAPVPAPRFRQQTSLVREATALNQRTVEIHLEPTRAALAPSVLTVPILPKHRWQSRSSFEHEYFTEAITATVESPVGSGPLRFGSAESGQSVTFRRFDNHFLRTTSDLPDALDPFDGGPAYDTLEAEGAPNIGVVLDDIADGTVDVLDGTIPVEDVPAARERSDVRVLESPTPSYYVIGLNARDSPLSNYAFRSALGRLIDRDHLVADVFDGVATATETPLHTTDWVPADLRWDGESVTGPFPGEDGDLDREAARQLFRDAGFRYHDETLRGR